MNQWRCRVPNRKWERPSCLFQLTPAQSREGNQSCVLFSFYDDHDVWHFLSSMALFFSFMVSANSTKLFFCSFGIIVNGENVCEYLCGLLWKLSEKTGKLGPGVMVSANATNSRVTWVLSSCGCHGSLVRCQWWGVCMRAWWGVCVHDHCSEWVSPTLPSLHCSQKQTVCKSNSVYVLTHNTPVLWWVQSCKHSVFLWWPMVQIFRYFASHHESVHQTWKQTLSDLSCFSRFRFCWHLMTTWSTRRATESRSSDWLNAPEVSCSEKPEEPKSGKCKSLVWPPKFWTQRSKFLTECSRFQNRKYEIQHRKELFKTGSARFFRGSTRFQNRNCGILHMKLFWSAGFQNRKWQISNRKYQISKTGNNKLETDHVLKQEVWDSSPEVPDSTQEAPNSIQEVSTWFPNRKWEIPEHEQEKTRVKTRAGLILETGNTKLNWSRQAQALSSWIVSLM